MSLVATSKQGTSAPPLPSWGRPLVLALLLLASPLVLSGDAQAAPKDTPTPATAKSKPTAKGKAKPKAKAKAKPKAKPKPKPKPKPAPGEAKALPSPGKPPAPVKPAAAKPARTQLSSTRPITVTPARGKAEAFNPELVDWQSVPPGQAPPPPKREKAPTPWSAKLSMGAGVDSNTDLVPAGSENSLLAGLGLYAQTPIGRNFRISSLGLFESNIGADVPAAAAAEMFAGYLGELPKDFQLRVSNLLYYSRKRSVFADGTVLREATTLQTIFGDNLAALVAWRKAAFDLEFGTQGSYELHSGELEDSRLVGVDGIAALRYTFRDRLSFRLRYSYEYSSTTGLSSRNLAGGIDSQNLPLKIGVHRVRFGTRARISRDSQIVARFDRVYATDDFSGFLNSHENVAFLGWVAQSPRWTLEGDLQYARRFFTLRIPTADNPNEDTVLSGNARVDFWALFSKRLGIFALYRYEKASAKPTGLLFERHVVMGGLSGRFGGTR